MITLKEMKEIAEALLKQACTDIPESDYFVRVWEGGLEMSMHCAYHGQIIGSQILSICRKTSATDTVNDIIDGYKAVLTSISDRLKVDGVLI